MGILIILFNPRSSASGKAILPMSILSIAAVLEGHYDYEIVDGNLCDNPLEKILSLILKNSELKIVWGGYFPTMYESAALSAPHADFLLRGHSEEAFVALVAALREKTGWRNQAGLSYRDPDTDQIVSNPIGPVPDLNTLPAYPYHRLPMERYTLNTFLGSRTLSHHASYGCPFTCNFCGVVNMVNGRYAAQSAEKVASVAKLLVKTYGANAIQFYDNNFFVSESRSAEICERLLPLNIAWWAYGRIDTLMNYSDRTWALMRDSGLRMIYLGAEAGSNEALKRMNKGGKQTADMTIEIAARLRSYGIVPELSFVLGSPPDPEEDIRRTFEFIRRIKQVNGTSEIILYPYTPVPVDGALYDEARASGFVFPQTIDDWADDRWIQFSERTTNALPWLSDATRASIGDFQRVLHAAYPTSTDPHLTGIRRALLRAAGLWRYKLRLYAHPIELRLLNRLIPHKRPEVTGF